MTDKDYGCAGDVQGSHSNMEGKYSQGPQQRLSMAIQSAALVQWALTSSKGGRVHEGLGAPASLHA